MYPTVVTILVETRRSMTDMCEISPWNTSKLAGPVASEALPVTPGEAEAQCSGALQSQGGREYRLEEVILEVKESQVRTSG